MKRIFDVVLSGFGLLVSLPFWLFFALLIRLQDGGPVFYGQERVGKDGRIFRALKFRSMIVDAEKKTGAVWAAENDPRVTKVGRLLRATAMDELPQLWNIFKGEMSFVGPRAERPQLVEQFAVSIKGYRSRLAAKPGLTGLAQVYGRYDTLPQHKLKYDRLYVRRQSMGLDLRLILVSFFITFAGKWEHRGKRIGKRLHPHVSRIS